jgi:uracil-DNA glycosylase
MGNCRYYLDKEVYLLQPKIIIALGGPAFTQLTGMTGIMKHHGDHIFSPRYKTVVVPVLHPSPLNTNHPDKRMMFFEDLESAKRALDET